MRLPVLALFLLSAGCLARVHPLPGDWSVPRTGMSALDLRAVLGNPDPLAAEDTVRAAVKPPSLCVADPAACNSPGPSFSLAALRPAEETLDDLERVLQHMGPAWPRASRALHCETLVAWRPAAGTRCVQALADEVPGPDGVVATEGLLDGLGPHGNKLVLGWLRSPDVEVRRAAARYVGERAADDALLVPLVEALDNEPDAVAAADLVRGVGRLRDARTMIYLEKLVPRTKQSSVRAELFRALEWLGDPSYRARFMQRVVPVGEADMRARDEVLADLRDVYARPALVPADLSGAFDFWSLAPDVDAGGIAFVNEFQRVHGRQMMWARGEVLTPAETGDLVRRLQDAGGLGLGAVRSTLALSCDDTCLPHLLEVRRSIHVAGQPNRDAQARDLTVLLQVIRTHHRAGRPTVYFARQPRAAGEPLKFMP